MIVFSSLVIIFYSSHTRYHRNIIIAGGFGGDGNYYDSSASAHDDILEYNPEKDYMVTVGQMTQARAWNAVSVVQAQDFSVWCQ